MIHMGLRLCNLHIPLPQPMTRHSSSGGDQGWVIQIMSTQKTEEWVRVPIAGPFPGPHPRSNRTGNPK
jgi:hypothetical protein